MSAVLEREVSEGIPIDGRIFEPPQANTDVESPRYLAFVGSLIEPQTAKNRPWTKGGGIEVSNPCLQFVKNFVRKGRITPVLKDTHKFIPYDVAKKIVDGDPTQHGYFRQGIPAGYKPPNLPPARGVGYGTDPSPVGTLVGRLALPGDAMNSILTGSGNISHDGYSRGIVEITSLKAVDYRPSQLEGGMYVDPSIWQMQRAIFPDYPFFYNEDRQPTVLLDDIERILDDAAHHVSLREIVDDFMQSLTLFRDYASTTIQNAHAKMREIAAKTEGYIPRYTAMDLVLLEQLGMERQDREIRQAVATGSNTKLESMFEQWLAISLEEKQANLERQKRIGEVSINESTMAASPITNETPDSQPEAVEFQDAAPVETDAPSFDCDCGAEAKSLAGLRAHQRACKLTKEV